MRLRTRAVGSLQGCEAAIVGVASSIEAVPAVTAKAT